MFLYAALSCVFHTDSQKYTLCKHNFFINDYLMRCGGNTQDTALPNFLQDQMGLLHDLDKQVWPCSSLHNTPVHDKTYDTQSRSKTPGALRPLYIRKCPSLPLHFNLLGHLQALLITIPLVTSTSQLNLIFPVLQNFYRTLG